jgi:hypothetical protein
MRLKRHDASSSLALISHAAESTYEKKAPRRRRSWDVLVSGAGEAANRCHRLAPARSECPKAIQRACHSPQFLNLPRNITPAPSSALLSSDATRCFDNQRVAACPAIAIAGEHALAVAL